MRLKTAISILLVGLSAPAVAEPAAGSKDPIIVTGNRAEEAEMTADMAKAITWRPPANKPLPKHYEPVCLQIFGIDADIAEVMAERMRDNMRALNLRVLGGDCSANLWVGFAPDSHAAVTRLRKDDPAIFGDLKDYEIDRILAGSKASQAWFSREDKGIDGKPMTARIIEIGGVEVTVRENDAWRASRITGTIRVDMVGSIVIFDRALSAGKSIRQLADYATFRGLAPVKDISEQESQPLSILSLFAKDVSPAAGLTEFDWAYLAGYYKLGEHVDSAGIHDAAKRAFLAGTGEKAADKAGAPIAD